MQDAFIIEALLCVNLPRVPFLHTHTYLWCGKCGKHGYDTQVHPKLQKYIARDNIRVIITILPHVPLVILIPKLKIPKLFISLNYSIFLSSHQCDYLIS